MAPGRPGRGVTIIVGEAAHYALLRLSWLQ